MESKNRHHDIGRKPSRDIRRQKQELPNRGKYDRPTGFPKGFKDTVWNNAKDARGKVRDDVTGKVMNKNKPWDMGHKPGYEFYKHKQSAMERGISRQQFRKEYYNPNHFRPELPSSNRSHKGENKTKRYFGP